MSCTVPSCAKACQPMASCLVDSTPPHRSHHRTARTPPAHVEPGHVRGAPQALLGGGTHVLHPLRCRRQQPHLQLRHGQGIPGENRLQPAGGDADKIPYQGTWSIIGARAICALALRTGATGSRLRLADCQVVLIAAAAREEEAWQSRADHVLHTMTPSVDSTSKYQCYRVAGRLVCEPSIGDVRPLCATMLTGFRCRPNGIRIHNASTPLSLRIHEVAHDTLPTYEPQGTRTAAHSTDESPNKQAN